MTNMPPKLSTKLACRVARIDRDRFNEHAAAERFPCAPRTIPGRARYFDPDDMISLWLFHELLEDGMDAHSAGVIACKVGLTARLNPEASTIAYVQTYFGASGEAYVSDHVPDASKWDEAYFGGTDIRKVTTFRIGKMRRLIAQATADELSHFGEED